MSWLMYATRSTRRTIFPSSVRRRRAAPGVADDTVAHRHGQVQARPVAREHVHHPQRLLVVSETGAEALAQAAVERLLADVTKRRVPEIVPESDRLDEVLVQRSARATVRETCVTSSVWVSRVR